MAVCNPLAVSAQYAPSRERPAPAAREAESTLPSPELWRAPVGPASARGASAGMEAMAIPAASQRSGAESATCHARGTNHRDAEAARPAANGINDEAALTGGDQRAPSRDTPPSSGPKRSKR